MTTPSYSSYSTGLLGFLSSSLWWCWALCVCVYVCFSVCFVSFRRFTSCVCVEGAGALRFPSTGRPSVTRWRFVCVRVECVEWLGGRAVHYGDVSFSSVGLLLAPDGVLGCGFLDLSAVSAPFFRRLARLMRGLSCLFLFRSVFVLLIPFRPSPTADELSFSVDFSFLFSFLLPRVFVSAERRCCCRFAARVRRQVFKPVRRFVYWPPLFRPISYRHF